MGVQVMTFLDLKDFQFGIRLTASCRLLIYLISLCFPWPAMGGDLIVYRGLHADPTGYQNIGEVVTAPFQTVGPTIAKGYSRNPQWIRLDVATLGNDEPVELCIRSTFLDEIRLYEPDFDRPGQWKTRVTGDRYSFKDRDRKTISLGFIVSPRSPQTTYYLRIKTTSTMLFDVEALTPLEAGSKELKFVLRQVALLGAALWLLFWGINEYIQHRQETTGWFVVYQISFIFYELGYMGFFAPFVPTAWPELNDLLTSLSIINIVNISFPLYRSILRPFQPNIWLFKLLGFVMMIYPLLFTAVVAGYGFVVLRINVMMIGFLSLAILFLAMTARRESPPGRRALRALLGLQVLFLMVTMAPLLGWGGKAEWALNLLLIHNIIADIIIFTILFLHSKDIAHEGQLAQLQLGLAKQQLNFERSQKENQERFMAMLTHELRTPMSVVRLALGKMSADLKTKRHADLALVEMDGIVERCRQLDQLEHHKLIINSAPCQINQLIEALTIDCGYPDRISLHMDALPAIITDHQLLRVVCTNLLGNALKYSSPHSKVYLMASSITREDNTQWIRIVFSNQSGSAGLPDPEKVFTKYYRSPLAHSTTGAGLGLYLVKGLVAMLRGEVGYKGDRGQVEFELCLPVE